MKTRFGEMTKAEVERIVRLTPAQMAQECLAKKYGVSVSTIRRRLTEARKLERLSA